MAHSVRTCDGLQEDAPDCDRPLVDRARLAAEGVPGQEVERSEFHNLLLEKKKERMLHFVLAHDLHRVVGQRVHESLGRAVGDLHRVNLLLGPDGMGQQVVLGKEQ